MAFRLPTFNLTCSLFGNQAVPPPNPARIFGQACQLAWDHSTVLIRGGLVRHMALIRFPAHTDVRGILQAGGTDLIECPSGSHVYYTCYAVADVAKGFPNEYRVAICEMVASPTPLP